MRTGWGVIGSAAQVKTLISPIIEGHDHILTIPASRCERKVSISKLGSKFSGPKVLPTGLNHEKLFNGIFFIKRQKFTVSQH